MSEKAAVTSWLAYVITLAVLAGGFVWATFYVAAPYEILAWAVVALAGAYLTKRLMQKQEKFGGASNRVDISGKETGD